MGRTGRLLRAIAVWHSANQIHHGGWSAKVARQRGVNESSRDSESQLNAECGRPSGAARQFAMVLDVLEPHPPKACENSAIEGSNIPMSQTDNRELNDVGTVSLH